MFLVIFCLLSAAYQGYVFYLEDIFALDGAYFFTELDEEEISLRQDGE